LLRRSARAIAAVVLLIGVLQASTFAEVAPALGQVIEAERAHLGGSSATSGSTLFDGDRLATDASGSLRARVGSGQLYLMAQSAAMLHRSASGASATLLGGTAIFAMANPESFELQALTARFRAHPGTAGGASTLGQVTVTGPKEFVIASHRGAIDVFIGDEMRTVAENTAVRVVLDPPDDKNPQTTTGAHPGAKRKVLFLWIVLGSIAAVTTVFVFRALHRVSPN
jgi:hypothetical protein